MLFYLGLTAFYHSIVILPLLAGLSLLVLGYWNRSEGAPPFSRMSWRAEVAMYLLLAASAGLALYLGRERLLFSLGLVLFGTLAGRWLPHSNALWKQVILVSLVLGLASGVALLVINFPLWALLPLPLALLLLTLLNLRFYSFFLRKRGVIFTLAVIPFHLLYYLYSLLAFTLTAGFYLWKSGGKGRV
jgi:hypothetical protein